MKKATMMFLAFSLLMLGSCSSRVPTETSTYSTVSKLSESENSTGSYESGFLVTGFDEKTQDELIQEYTYAIYYNERVMESVMNSPVSLYINTMNDSVLLSYDKLTGVFSAACRDTLCEHEICLWGVSGNRIYCGIDGLFFLINEDDDTTIYQSDFFGNNVRELYKSNNTLSYVVQENEYLYFLEETLDEATGETVGQILRLRLSNLNAEVLLSKTGLYYYMPLNEKILYLDEANGYVLYDPDEDQEQTYASTEMLPLALCGEYFYYETEGALYRRAEYGMGAAELLKNGTFTELFFGNGYIYYCTEENVIYRANEDFTDLLEIYTVSTESRISNIIVDGNLMFYKYSVRNGASRKHYFVFVDLETGEVLEVANE